jgi:hypothetical protein
LFVCVFFCLCVCSNRKCFLCGYYLVSLVLLASITEGPMTTTSYSVSYTVNGCRATQSKSNDQCKPSSNG